MSHGMLIQPLVDNTDPRMPDPGDVALARSAAEILCQHYPLWTWAVSADAKQGVMSIFNAALTGQYNWGTRVRLGSAESSTEWTRAIVNAGGEFLERFGCPRGPMTEEAIASMKRPEDVIAEAYRDAKRKAALKLVVGGAPRG